MACDGLVRSPASFGKDTVRVNAETGTDAGLISIFESQAQALKQTPVFDVSFFLLWSPLHHDLEVRCVNVRLGEVPVHGHSRNASSESEELFYYGVDGRSVFSVTELSVIQEFVPDFFVVRIRTMLKQKCQKRQRYHSLVSAGFGDGSVKEFAG
jgi:hypothetical protein